MWEVLSGPMLSITSIGCLPARSWECPGEVNEISNSLDLQKNGWIKEVFIFVKSKLMALIFPDGQA